MSKIIVDASVMVSILFKDEESKYSKLLSNYMKEGNQLVVPEIFHAEILNVLIVSEKRKRLDSDDIQKILKFLLDLKLITISHLDKEDVLKLAKRYDLTSYDAIYLSLAKRESRQLATLDKKLKEACIAEDIFWSGEVKVIDP